MPTPQAAATRARPTKRVRIGPPPSAPSYLRHRSHRRRPNAQDGADALHPGYGFLSENAGFAAALEAAGIVFIGPDARAIAAMGDKIEAVLEARDIGAVSRTVPGRLETIPDAETAVRIAREVGFPVMLKAAAGGGGKGMRIARSEAEVREGYRGAANEARASFADDRLFIEALYRRAAPYRDPGAGRRARACGASLRARMLDPAPPPESDRGERRRLMLDPATSAPPWARRLWRSRAPPTTGLRGRSSSCSIPSRQILLPRDEHAASGSSIPVTEVVTVRLDLVAP